MPCWKTSVIQSRAAPSTTSILSMSPTRTGRRPTSAISCSTPASSGPRQKRSACSPPIVGSANSSKPSVLNARAKRASGATRRVGVRVIPALGAHVVARVDDEPAGESGSVLREQVRDRCARDREQHDLRRSDRLADRDARRGLRRARPVHHLMACAAPGPADRRADRAAAEHRDACHDPRIRRRRFRLEANAGSGIVPFAQAPERGFP